MVLNEMDRRPTVMVNTVNQTGSRLTEEQASRHVSEGVSRSG